MREAGSGKKGRRDEIFFCIVCANERKRERDIGRESKRGQWMN